MEISPTKQAEVKSHIEDLKQEMLVCREKALMCFPGLRLLIKS